VQHVISIVLFRFVCLFLDKFQFIKIEFFYLDNFPSPRI